MPRYIVPAFFIVSGDSLEMAEQRAAILAEGGHAYLDEVHPAQVIPEDYQGADGLPTPNSYPLDESDLLPTDGRCSPDCPGWAVFNADEDGTGGDVQACDECGTMTDEQAAAAARAAGFVVAFDPLGRCYDVISAPEAKAALLP